MELVRKARAGAGVCGCECVCRNRTGVHAMRARRLKGPRGQAMTQSNRNGKRALVFCFGFCFVVHPWNDWLVWFSVWLLVVDQLLWMGWMDLPFTGRP